MESEVYTLGLGTLSMVGNPLDAASQLSKLLAALQHAAETAQLCNDICTDIFAMVESKTPILCKLLVVGNVYADQEAELNAAMSKTLWLAVHGLGDAADVLYEYISLRKLFRWHAVASTTEKMEEKRMFLTNRFNDIQSHVQLSKSLRAHEGVAQVVEAVECIRRDLLEALQHLCKADRPRVQAIAAAAVKRKSGKGQRVVVRLAGSNRRWLRHTVAEIASLFEVGREVTEVVVSSDGKWFATCDSYERVAVWDAATGMHLRDLQKHGDRVTCCACSPDGSMLAIVSSGRAVAVGCAQSTVKLWDVTTGAVGRVMKYSNGHITVVAWSSDGRQVCTGEEIQGDGIGSHDDDGFRHLSSIESELKSGEILLPEMKDATAASDENKQGGNQNTGGCAGRFHSLGFSYTYTATVWEVATGAVVHVLEGHTDWIRSVSWSPDGTLVATGSCDKTVRLWEVATGAVVRVLRGHTFGLLCVVWRPDGRMLASCSRDHTVKVWDVATGTVKHTLHGQREWVGTAAWRPDGHVLATGSDDSTVTLWDVATGTVKRVIQDANHHGVNSVAWSPCGWLVFAATQSGRTVGNEFVESHRPSTVRIYKVSAGT